MHCMACVTLAVASCRYALGSFGVFRACFQREYTLMRRQAQHPVIYYCPGVSMSFDVSLLPGRCTSDDMSASHQDSAYTGFKRHTLYFKVVPTQAAEKALVRCAGTPLYTYLEQS